MLSSFRLDARCLAILDALNTWTRCCEISVAASVHACLEDCLRGGLASRLPGSAGANRHTQRDWTTSGDE